MAKKKISKYYAIKKGKNVENKIVRTWEACKRIVDGYPSIYKSFKTEEEAIKYLKKNINVEEKQEVIKKCIVKSKKIKSTTSSLNGLRINKEVMVKFEEKCNDFGMTKDFVIENLIKEWLE